MKNRYKRKLHCLTQSLFNATPATYVFALEYYRRDSQWPIAHDACSLVVVAASLAQG